MSVRTIKGLRWWMMGLLMLGAVINYLTRSTLAVAAPTLLTDLRIGKVTAVTSSSKTSMTDRYEVPRRRRRKADFDLRPFVLVTKICHVGLAYVDRPDCP